MTPANTSPRGIDPLQEIEALVAYDNRWAGTEGERRAAEHLAARLRSLGRDVEVEPAVVCPDYPLTYVLHILLALAGGAVSARRPRLGAAALSLALASAFGDSNGLPPAPAPDPARGDAQRAL